MLSIGLARIVKENKAWGQEGEKTKIRIGECWECLYGKAKPMT